MSNQQPGDNRNALTDALSWLGTAGLAYAVFMGMIYAYGNLWVAIVGALVIFLLATGLRMYLVVLKKRKDSYKNKMPENIILGIVTVVFLISFVFILHYLDIDFSRKAEIKNKGRAKLAHVSNMVESSISFAENKVDSFGILIDQRLENYLNNNYNDAGKWNALVATFSDGDQRIKPSLEGETYYYNSRRNTIEGPLRARVKAAKEFEAEVKRELYSVGFLKDQNDAYIKNNRPVIFDVDKHYARLYNTARSKMSDFTYPDPAAENLYLDDPLYALKNFNSKSILFALVAGGLLFFLILSDYLFFKRYVPDVKLVDRTDTEEDEDDLRKKRILERTRGSN